MGMGGVVIKNAVNEKYLGDWVNELGCKESIEDTIKDRIRKLTSKVNEIILLADAPMMGADGSSRAAIKLFEAQVVPALLFNCESWIRITETQINDLQVPGQVRKETDVPTYIDTKSDIALGQWNGNDEVENSQEEITILEKSYGQREQQLVQKVHSERDNTRHGGART